MFNNPQYSLHFMNLNAGQLLLTKRSVTSGPAAGGTRRRAASAGATAVRVLPVLSIVCGGSVDTVFPVRDRGGR